MYLRICMCTNKKKHGWWFNASLKYARHLNLKQSFQVWFKDRKYVKTPSSISSKCPLT